jgi:hypothetical protein
MVGVPWSDEKECYSCRNGREVHLEGLPNLKVDGYCAETNEVFEFLGCFWHGCPSMPNRHKAHWQNRLNFAESVSGNNGEAAKDKGRRLYCCFDLRL